jgi:serine/threonine protein kinase
VQRLELAHQACQVLHLLHSRGKAHGNLKPENLLIQKQGEGFEVKFSDFHEIGEIRVREAQARDTLKLKEILLFLAQRIDVND